MCAVPLTFYVSSGNSNSGRKAHSVNAFTHQTNLSLFQHVILATEQGWVETTTPLSVIQQNFKMCVLVFAYLLTECVCVFVYIV